MRFVNLVFEVGARLREVGDRGFHPAAMRVEERPEGGTASGK